MRALNDGGVGFERAPQVIGLADPDRSDRFRLSPNLTFYATEFSKFRLQWNYDHGQLRGDDNSVWFQTEFMLGSHAAHKF